MTKYQRNRLTEQKITTIDQFAKYNLEKILLSEQDPLISLQKQKLKSILKIKMALHIMIGLKSKTMSK